MSPVPWVDELCRDAVSRAVDFLLPELETRGLRVLFLGGSASLGEACGWSGAGGERWVLSDLDLGVVTWSPVEPEVRDRIEAGLADLRDPQGPEITLGFYESERQSRQLPTPGLVDLVAGAVPLSGPPEVLARFQAPPAGSIPRWEAYRLLGNRARELLEAPDSPQGERARAERYFRLGKAILGLWTACLILQDRYRVGREARLELLDDREVRSRIPGSIPRAVDAWRDFGTAPGEDRLPAPESRLPLFRLAWREFFGESPVAPYLAERASVRDRIRLWKEAVRGREGARTENSGSHWTWALRSRLEGTPEGRRLGAAVLYWYCLPERPEPTWGDPGGADEDRTGDRVASLWREGSRALLGREIASGPGCRERLRSAISPRG